MDTRHVPNLEICQEFDTLCKEKGIVVPETEFYWNIKNKTLTSKPYRYIHTTKYRNLPAPLVSEQGEIFNKVGAKNFIKAYGDVFNFPGTGMVGDLGVINLMRRPNMGMKMLNYLIETGRVTEL